jgi:hypothetical protein
MGRCGRDVLKFIGWLAIILAVVAHPPSARALPDVPMDDSTASCAPPGLRDIAAMQKKISSLPAGDRIAFWAGRFIGTPYDTDPLGAYVRSRLIVSDPKVDCMYHVFRSVELGLTGTPEEAYDKALELRFKTHGKVAEGKVVNYDERFQYAEDMIASGKWGKDVTAGIAEPSELPGSRGYGTVVYIPKGRLLEKTPALKSGDIVYFVKDPSRRVVGEIVGHLGIIKVEGGRASLIHASGSKDTMMNKGCGSVKEVDFTDYVSRMKFVGIKVTRFTDAR